MRTIKICLALNEMEYGEALALGLLRINRFFSIVDPTKENYDILVTDDISLAADRMVYLTVEQGEEIIDEDRKLFILYKYQHVGRISKMLRLAHSLYSDTEMLSDECERTNIISVCASAGGAGCTSVAFGLCLELTRFHKKKVLYLNLEEFESTTKFIPDDCNGEQNISRYLYRLRYGKMDKTPSAAGYLTQEQFGISSFRSARGRNPLRELNETEFVKFINNIVKERLFTDVVLDCGNGLDDAIVSAMKLSCCICHINGRTQNDQRRKTYIQTALNRTGEEEKICWLDVNNFSDAVGTADDWMQHEPEEGQIVIVRSDSSFVEIDGIVNISMDKSFGHGIRNLLGQIQSFCR
jgi:hypothetical protein